MSTEFGATLEDLAALARPIALQHFRSGGSIEIKADASPVTIADRDIERAMRGLLSERYPDHGVFGEEFGASRGERFTWYLDPIDGTKSFITGMPLFGTLIALRDEEVGRVPYGLIDMPALGECWLGTPRGTTHNGRVARASTCQRLAEAQVYTSSPDIFEPADWLAFDRLSRGALYRRFGGDCYLYGLLASGHCDLVVEAGLKPFDYMALIPVVEGAGGRIRDWLGRPLHPGSDGRVVAAATPTLLDEALATLAA